MKAKLWLILTLLTIVTLAFLPTGFADDTVTVAFEEEEEFEENGVPQKPIVAKDWGYEVRIIYFLPNDLEAPSDIDNELDTLIKNVQNVYAAQLEVHGFERKTFRFEADKDGNAIVHHIKGKFNDGYYQQRGVWNEINEQYDTSYEDSNFIYLCFFESRQNCAYVQGSDEQSCILGLGGGNSLNGTALVLYESVDNDDRFVNSENVAIHELCHAFGLPHDRRFNARRIFATDYTDRMVTSFSTASWLDAHRYFNETLKPFNLDTQVEMLTPVLGSPWPNIRFRFEITDLDGLHQVLLNGPQNDSLIDYERLDGSTNKTVEFTTSNWSGESHFQLYVMDVYGNFRTFLLRIDVTDVLPSPEKIAIPDMYLAAAVKETLDIPEEDPITQIDVLRLRKLIAGQSEITDITGLEHALNLERLDLPDTKIRDVTPLSGLTKLRSLSLRNTQIRDISPLTSLTVLEELNISGNQISDIKLLASLTQLKRLELWKNQITDITPLASLTALESLALMLNKIKNIKALSGLTQLNSLTLFGNQVSDISPLSDLKQLRSLDLRKNQVSNISPLSGLTQLKRLELWRNEVTDITPLASLVALEYLDISNNPTSDVTSLAGLVNLKEVRLVGNPIKNRKPLLALLQKNPDVKIYLKNIDEPLPVTLSRFKAVHTADGAVINWTTESEQNNAGFNILRSDTKNGEYRQVNAKLIKGAGTTGERNEYTWTDSTAKPNTVYYYQIEDVSHAGVRKRLATVRLRGLVSASGKRITSWADLKVQN